MAREKGYARQPTTGYTIPTASSEDNWELRWPHYISVYSKMAREDAQVKSVLQALIKPITRTPWYIDPNGADPEIVRAVAQDLNLPVKGETTGAPIAKDPRRVSFREHLKRLLKWKLVYGHAYFELVWDDATETDDGLTHLRKIAPRHPDTIYEIAVAKDGGLEHIKQRPIGLSSSEVKIPVKDLLVYLNDDDSDAWVGESILRAAYKHWKLKDEFLRLEQITLDRNGMGVAVMKLRPEAHPDEQKDAEAIVDNVRSGAEGGAVIKHEESLTIEGVKGQLQPARPAIVYHDAQIARTALAHALNLDGGGGSYALAEVQMDLFFQGINDIAQSVADTANQYLVRKMVYMLTGDTKGPFPVIVFDKIEAKKSLSSNDLAALKNAGLIFADPALEAHIRRIYEMPSALPPDQWDAARGAPLSTSDAPAQASTVLTSIDPEVVNQIFMDWIHSKTQRGDS